MDLWLRAGDLKKILCLMFFVRPRLDNKVAAAEEGTNNTPPSTLTLDATRLALQRPTRIHTQCLPPLHLVTITASAPSGV